MAQTNPAPVKTAPGGNEEDDISMVLEGVGLQRHFPRIFKEGIKWDAFTNMTVEDFNFLGITDKEEQAALINILQSMSLTNSEFTKAVEVDPLVMLKESTAMLRRIRGKSVVLLRKLEQEVMVKTLIDQNTSCASSIFKFISLLDETAAKIDKEYKTSLYILSEMEENEKLPILRHIPQKVFALVFGLFFSEIVYPTILY